MRTVYAAALAIRDESDISASLDYVGRWIQDWYLRHRLTVDISTNLQQGDLELTPAEGHQLFVRHHATKASTGDRLTDLRWSYPDQYDKSLGWSVALSILRHTEGLLLTVEIAVTGLQLLIAPAEIRLGSPRVIRDISRLHSVRIGSHPYRLTPELVGAEYVELLVSELVETTRPYPIVLVSRRLPDDVPLTDSGELADRLAGAAKVYELADKWAGYRLSEELGKPLSCYSGAVRLYWPGFNEQADPFSHPVWMPWQFKDADASERTLRQLCSKIFEAAAFRHVEPISIRRLRSEAERETRAAARSSGTKSENDLLEDLIEMEEKLVAAEAANATLTQENKTLRENAIALLAHRDHQDSAPTNTSQSANAPAEPSAATSVEDAVRRAETASKHLRFLPSAHSSALESPYRLPERVQEALAALDEVTSIWAMTIDSGTAGRPIRQLFRDRGFDYADSVSQTSKGKWGPEYTALYKDQELDISPHITLGAKQPDTCLSIHWAWHRGERVAVVAHVGRHKTNTKT